MYAGDQLVIPAGGVIFDVTMPVSADLPVWPGDPDVVVAPVTRIDDGEIANVSQVTLSSHSGTHVDAPWHFVAGGARLDEIPPQRWIGPCIVIDVPDDVDVVEPAHLERAMPMRTERLLMKTRNSRQWRPGKLFFERRYVALSADAAHWIAAQGVQLVGIDYLSIDPFDDETHAAHFTLLGRGIVIVEGLNLRAVEPGPYQLLCLPLRLTVGDGAPARVLLIQESSAGTETRDGFG